MNQIALPVDVRPAEIARKPTLGAAIELCAEVAGLEWKEVQHALKLDKAQWSRWITGHEGVIWPRLQSLMDTCGNDTPVLWMAHQRGFDIGRMHRYETELERENRLLREENAALRRVMQGPTA